MEPIIKPIETVYNGYRFRSRLEARWAVFFDTAGIAWEYEKEGFELSDGTRYLPDFWLPDANAWVEIKPESGALQQLEKVQQFAQAIAQDYEAASAAYIARTPNPIAAEMHDISEELYRLSHRVNELTDRMMTMEHGDVYIPRAFYISILLDGYGDEFNAMDCDLDGGPDLPPEVYVCQGAPYRNGPHHAYSMTRLFPPMEGEPRWWVEREGGHIAIGSLRSAVAHSERLASAYTAARQARFEHGERGRRR